MYSGLSGTGFFDSLCIFLGQVSVHNMRMLLDCVCVCGARQMWTSVVKNLTPVHSGVRMLSALSAVPVHVAISCLPTVNTAKV